MDIRTQRLRNAFEQSGLSQTELCEKADINKGAFSSYLSGRYFPKQKSLEKLSTVLGVSIKYLMGIEEDFDLDISDLPSNAILPSAKSIPIMGTICAGDGIVCEDDYSGNFIIDADINADYCLRVQGDSMQTANIFDGDLVFIKKDCDIESGKIYAVEKLDTKEAYLKKISLDKDSIILTPCNADYHPIVTDFSEVRIVGECIGVLHKY